MSSTQTAALREDARTISLIGLAHGSSHFFQMLLPPLFPWFIREFGLSYSELGLLVTTFFVISGIGQALAGFLVDRTGARPVLFAALACFALAALSAGRIGWAMDVAEDPSLLEQRQAALDAVSQALSAGTVQRFRLAEALAARDPQTVDDVLELWLSWLRDALLVIEDCAEHIVNRDQEPHIRAAAAALNSLDLQRAIRAVQAARAQVAGAINTRMALEVLMLHLPATPAARPDPARQTR